MHDTLEFESRGTPVALITTTARIVEVVKRDGVFHLRHGFAGQIHATLGTPWAAKSMAKFGYHRALRMAGCHEGDPVQLPGGTVSWRFPATDDERAQMPAGFGKWCSAADGVRGLQTITVEDPVHGLSASAIAGRADEIVPQSVSILTNL